MARKDPDFLSWEYDIDLDALLGEYTEDENDPESSVKEKCLDIYVGPECAREYKSTSGFRGHVMKKHDMNLKAYKHKKGIQTPKGCEPINRINEELNTIFKDVYDKSISNIINDPMYNIFEESTEARIDKCSRGNTELREEFEVMIKNVFKDNSAASSNEREKVFHKFHSLRTDPIVVKELTCAIKNQVGPNQFNESEINNFIQAFLLNIIGEIFKGLVNVKKTNSEVKSELLSDNDTKVLYYICGYIILALQKKYNKLRNKTTRETKLEMTKHLTCKSTETTHTEKFKSMVDYKNRGGLKTPCDEVFFMVREFENVTRQNVDHDNYNAYSLQKDQLKDSILDSFMVKHYSAKLFGSEDDNEREVYVEDCINLFLTIRGFAVAKLINRTMAKNSKELKKSSHSLRDTLKSVNSNKS